MATQKFNLKIPQSLASEINTKIQNNNISQEVPDNLKTLLQLSKDISVDKQKIYRCIHKYNIPYQVIDEIMYLDEAGQTLVKSKFIPDFTITQNTICEQEKTDNDAILKQLEITIKMFKEEIDNKSLQLKKKDKQIAKLSHLVDQQQQLHMVLQKKYMELEEKFNKTVQ